MLGSDHDLDVVLPAETPHGERGEGREQVEKSRTHEGMATSLRLDSPQGKFASYALD